MKTPVSFVLLLLILASATFAQQSQQQSSKTSVTTQAVLAAIDTFRRDANTPEARAATPVILKFAEGSPDVEVTVSMQELPWMSETPDEKCSPLLLAAFFTGNIKSQLDRHVTKNDSLAGLVQVIETYKQLQKANPSFRSPGVEQLVTWQSQGKLADHLSAR